MPFPRHALCIPVPVTSDSSVSTSSQVKAEELKVAHKVAKKVTTPVYKAVTEVAPVATNKTSSKTVSGSYKRPSNRPARKAAKNTASMASSKATIGAATRAAAKVAVKASKNTINVRQDDGEKDTESEDDEMEQEREDRPGLVRIRALNKAPGLCYTDEKGKKRWPCNLCSRHWSRKDETRAHLRRVHYVEKYPEGFDKARGLKQAQLDCP
ncbi:Putative Zinc finger C2H2-type [Colletotrichum destructivum]|uniref:Zinc finger C2H2-type n=1 Tax=Colletotrichum destructivum TaxID=34406 RepID=A0AAX4IN59_9PEZI|nr:Putative Zinc finger C2H2-type [Colletotrichum destructivum]